MEKDCAFQNTFFFFIKHHPTSGASIDFSDLSKYVAINDFWNKFENPSWLPQRQQYVHPIPIHRSSVVKVLETQGTGSRQMKLSHLQIQSPPFHRIWRPTKLDVQPKKLKFTDAQSQFLTILVDCSHSENHMNADTQFWVIPPWGRQVNAELHSLWALSP